MAIRYIFRDQNDYTPFYKPTLNLMYFIFQPPVTFHLAYIAPSSILNNYSFHSLKKNYSFHLYVRVCLDIALHSKFSKITVT